MASATPDLRLPSQLAPAPNIYCFASKGVCINRIEPPKLGSAGTPPTCVRGVTVVQENAYLSSRGYFFLNNFIFVDFDRLFVSFHFTALSFDGWRPAPVCSRTVKSSTAIEEHSVERAHASDNGRAIQTDFDNSSDIIWIIPSSSWWASRIKIYPNTILSKEIHATPSRYRRRSRNGEQGDFCSRHCRHTGERFTTLPYVENGQLNNQDITCLYIPGAPKK